VTLGVWAQPLGDGVLFLGPMRRCAWSPLDYLSSALGYVVGHDVAAHPWQPWIMESATAGGRLPTIDRVKRKPPSTQRRTS
jgi:hypothetical protein